MTWLTRDTSMPQAATSVATMRSMLPGAQLLDGALAQRLLQIAVQCCGGVTRAASFVLASSTVEVLVRTKMMAASKSSSASGMRVSASSFVGAAHPASSAARICGTVAVVEAILTSCRIAQVAVHHRDGSAPAWAEKSAT